MVAPLVGAWIEIYLMIKGSSEYDVAPLVGAWIEIPNSYGLYTKAQVAPLVGAWIEIQRIPKQKQKRQCRSSCRSVD